MKDYTFVRQAKRRGKTQFHLGDFPNDETVFSPYKRRNYFLMIFIISLQSSEDRASIKTTQESSKATNTTKTTTTITKKKKVVKNCIVIYFVISRDWHSSPKNSSGNTHIAIECSNVTHLTDEIWILQP